MRGPILVLLLLLSANGAAQPGLQAIVDPQGGSPAWWMHTTLEPTGGAVRGIPIEAFDSGWCAAGEITVDAFPVAIRTGGQWPLEAIAGQGGSPFSVEGDFGSGERLEVLIGAYRTCTGETRNFLAVLAPARSEGRVVQVESISAGKAVFQYLVADADGRGLRIYSCLACDDMGRHYRWEAATGKFEVQTHVDETG